MRRDVAGVRAVVLGLAVWGVAAGLGPAPALGFGGFGGAEEPTPPPKERAPMTAEAARTWGRLQQKVDLPFSNETSLADLLRHAVAQTAPAKAGDGPGLQFYLDPVGLQESEKTEDSPVRINLERVPLASGLELVLQQLDLSFFVRPDGVVHITSAQSDRLPELVIRSVPPVSAAAARTWEALFKPVSMPFAAETPLEDVLRYVRSATTGEALAAGVPIYVDPVGLQEAEKTESTPIRLNMEGLPLAATLPLILDQLQLGFFIEDSGLIWITAKAAAKAKTAPAPTGERLAELEAEIEALTPKKPGGGMGGTGGGMGGEAAKPGGGFR